MKEILDIIQKMRVDCGWDKSDTLPILIKSVSVESSELLETIQWSEDEIDLQAVKSELADVLMYALSIAIDQNWDVKTLIEEKMVDVYKRYGK
ncbi:MAG: MazG-like family protein [Erysipelotrichaceae bacterium]